MPSVSLTSFHSAPVLLFIAALTFLYGQDHPAGKWCERHTALAPSARTDGESSAQLEVGEDLKHRFDVGAHPIDDKKLDTTIHSTVDVAVNESLTFKTSLRMFVNPLTWLPACAYLTTFGLSLTIDGQMANVLFNLFSKNNIGFDQNRAGYYTSIL